MPTIQINTTFPENNPVQGLPPFLRLPQGLVMIEIQGTIHRPTAVPQQFTSTSDDPNPAFIKTKHGKDAVNIGKLKFDIANPNSNKVELLIGKNQKLVGSIKELEKPLGILQFPKLEEPSKANDQEYLKTQRVQLMEIVKHKLIFSNRPVPLMDS